MSSRVGAGRGSSHGEGRRLTDEGRGGLTDEALQQSFLRAVSHELRTPLSSVVGFAEVLAAGWRRLDPEAVDRHLETMVRTSRHLRDMIEDVLLFTSLSQRTPDRGHARIRRLDLSELTADVAALCEERGWDAEVIGGTGHVSLDVGLVRTVYRHLLTNAFQHGAPPVTVRLSLAHDDLLIAVEDAGDGLDAEARDNITEPFRGGRHRDDDAAPGLGLGLALVAQVAAHFDGDLEVEDRDGGGTRAWVRLCDVGTD